MIALAGTPGANEQGYGCPGMSNVTAGLAIMELARGDPSIATFMGVQSALAMMSIALLGSEDQKQRFLPPMARLEKIGAFDNVRVPRENRLANSHTFRDTEAVLMASRFRVAWAGRHHQQPVHDAAPLLQGLHVLDVASWIAGPAATTILSDFGADVIKVEPPGVGDTYRYFARIPPNPVVEGVNYAWQLDNRNKRSIELNLKSPAAKNVVERLVKDSASRHAHAAERFDARALTYGVVQTLEEMAHDQQLVANRILVPIDDGSAQPHLTIDSPVHLDQARRVRPRRAPELGQHTEEILAEIGLNSAAVEGLRAAAAIPASNSARRVA